MILFGWNRVLRRDHGPAVPMRCGRCGNDTVLYYVVMTTWFTLFFIPVVPYRLRRALVCPVCSHAVALSRDQAGQAKTLAVLYAGHHDGTVTADAYGEAVAAFFGLGAPVDDRGDATVEIEPAGAGPLVLAVPTTVGWTFDPFGRFAARYWDGSEWTAQVLDDDGHLGCDETPLGDPTSWFAASQAEPGGTADPVPAPPAAVAAIPPAHHGEPPRAPRKADGGLVTARDVYAVVTLILVALLVVGALVATGKLSVNLPGSGSSRVATGQRAAPPPSSSTGPVSLDTLQVAAANTQAAQSEEFTMSMSVETGTHHFSVYGSGAVTQDGKHVRIDLSVPGVAHVETLGIDESIYMNLDGLGIPARQLPAGKHWVRIDLADIAAQAGVDLDTLRQQAQDSTPTNGLEYLQGLSGEVTRVGDDTVNGAHATHYRAAIDYPNLANQVPTLTPQARQQLTALGTLPADVWIDDANRIVKMQLTVDASAYGAQGHAEMTMEISRFGAPVDIQAPPPEEVIGISELPPTRNRVPA